MRRILGLLFFISCFCGVIRAQGLSSIVRDTVYVVSEQPKKLSRLTLGGYGEAVMTRNFYSDEWQRYTNAEKYRDAKSHGRFDIPHMVIFIGYDFGKGWSMGTEIEFEHGGVETSIEMEAEETGEYESEIERGGEVALEQIGRAHV